MHDQDVRVDSTAAVDPSAALGKGTVVWGGALVRERAVIGPGCIIGRNAYVDAGVRLGARCKVQDSALLYEPAELGDGVFIGPAVVLTNDRHPRAVTPDGRLKAVDDWVRVGVTVADGASIGARAVCVAPVRIGRWAVVGAGAVVTHDVPDHGLVAGAPARQVGWVGRAGKPLEAASDGLWTCPATGETYVEKSGRLTRVEGSHGA